jgi:hypothetical protein
MRLSLDVEADEGLVSLAETVMRRLSIRREIKDQGAPLGPADARARIRG